MEISETALHKLLHAAYLRGRAGRPVAAGKRKAHAIVLPPSRKRIEPIKLEGDIDWHPYATARNYGKRCMVNGVLAKQCSKCGEWYEMSAFLFRNVVQDWGAGPRKYTMPGSRCLNCRRHTKG